MSTDKLRRVAQFVSFTVSIQACDFYHATFYADFERDESYRSKSAAFIILSLRQNQSVSEKQASFATDLLRGISSLQSVFTLSSLVHSKSII